MTMSGTIISADFWRGKKVFLTGHTGFKGSWLSIWLASLGASVKGYALPHEEPRSLFGIARVADVMESEMGDIRDYDALERSVVAFAPDILIHMAAQPLVRQSYADPLATYQTNVMGTAHVLEAARRCSSLRAVVNVTTDKCYENKEWHWGYRETDPMGGFDPYSSSKGCSELVTAAYRRSFFDKSGTVGVATARAGNVVGGGDWATDRLVPDALRAFENADTLTIRNPAAIRPWQHVLEPLGGYLLLCERLYERPAAFAGAWNFGPDDADALSVAEVVSLLAEYWGDGARWCVDAGEHPHEAKYLKLDISKARAALGWQPRWQLGTSLQRIVAWHRAWLSGADMRQICADEISAFLRAEGE